MAKFNIISPKRDNRLNVIQAPQQEQLKVAQPIQQPNLKVADSPDGNLSATAPVFTPPPQPVEQTPQDIFTNNLVSQQQPTPLQQESRNLLANNDIAQPQQQQQLQQQQQAPQANPFTAPDATAFNTATQAHLKSLQPDQQVTDARKAYLDFIAGANLGINKLEGQGRGIPVGLVRGQQGQLREQAQIEAQRLQGNIDIATDVRGQRQGALKSQADFEKSLLAQQQPSFKTVGDNLVRVDPKTGQAESIFSGAEADSQKNISLASGSRLVNPTTGEVLVDADTTSDSDLDKVLTAKQLKELGIGNDKFGITQREAIQGIQSGELLQGQTLAQRRSSDQSNVAITNINKVLEALGGGFGASQSALGRAVAGFIPGTTSKNLEASMSTVKALVGFDALEKMRLASPTGGALGQVSERELSFLQSVEGSLDSSQGTEQLKATLERIKSSFERIRAINNPNTNIEEYLQKFPDATEEELQELEDKSQLTPVQSQEFNTLKEQFPDTPDQDIIDEILGFNNDLSTSENGSIKIGSRLGKVNNNPGNLRFVGQKGASQGEGGFARFRTPKAGYRALKSQISLDSSRGHTLESFITKFAPPVENDTTLYISQMAKAVRANKNTLLSKINLNNLAIAMAKKESLTIIR